MPSALLSDFCLTPETKFPMRCQNESGNSKPKGPKSGRFLCIFVRMIGVLIGLFGMLLLVGLLLAFPYTLGRLFENPPRIISPIIALLVVGFFVRIGWGAVFNFSPQIVWCVFGVSACLFALGIVSLASTYLIDADRLDLQLISFFVSLPVAGLFFNSLSTRTIQALFPDCGEAGPARLE